MKSFLQRSGRLARGLALATLAAGPILLGSAGHARGDVGQRFERLSQLRSELGRSRGPEAYVAIRRIWQEWDQGDPAEVEEVLAAATRDRALAPPARAYAGLLEAYARRRRGDLEGSKARIAQLGYLGRFAVAGPFDNEGKAGFARAFGPEEDIAGPLDLSKSYDGKERPVKWRLTPDVSPFGWFDLGVFVRPVENACAYASTFVRGRPEGKGARTISLWGASAGAMRVFWNGRPVLEDDKYRSLDADRVAAEVTLEDGWNRLVVKVCGTEDAPMFALRMADATGAPDPTLEADPDPAHAVEAATVGAKAKGRTTAKARIEGALQAFERLAKGADPKVLEAFARYLVLTSSDDPAENRARELADRAADKAPTIPRLLLAGDLAEDRNQQAEWINRADRLAKRGAPREERLALLLAKASLARSGANFRDAEPFYEEALVLDRDNVAAVLARAELYGEAGLRDTACTFLEEALARRPKSVALLRAYVSALRADNRQADADEAAERYASLRFDDPGLLRERMDLAIAHRDAAAASRWADRLLASHPDATASLGYVARGFDRIGDRARSIALWKRALELAPEDVDVMRSLADSYALAGKRDDQLALLRKVLELRPQLKEVREYVALTQPQVKREDEAYARPSTEFLKRRDDPARGEARRTLVDLQVTTVFANGLASRFHQVVFQPLTDAAATSAREYSFGYEADSETVQLRGARVYRKDGKIDEAVETGESNVDDPSISMYTTQRAYWVRFPRLDPGDVVELLYRVEDVTPRNAYADYFGEVVYLQSSEPVGHAEYVLITPKSRTFYFNKPKLANVERTENDKGPSRVFRYVAKDVPAISPEANQPPYAELLAHVHVSTYKSWDEMGRWYWGLARDQFVPDDEVKRRVAELTRGLTETRAKVNAVYKYVVQRTRYVALEFGIHGYKPYRCAQIFARGFGDCKDKATLIVTMLKELGIPATIVTVRTGLRGRFESEPASLAPFDHAIAYVPSLDLYLDGTAEWTGSNELPSMDRGSMALQINEGNPKLVTLPDPPPSTSVTSRRIEATLAQDGSATLEWQGETVGANAALWRSRYHAADTRRTRMLEDIGGEFAGFVADKIEASDLEDIEAKAVLKMTGRAPGIARREGATLSAPGGPKEHMVRQYASLSQRKLDLVLGAQNTTVSEWVLHFPAGYKPTSVPKAEEGTSPFGTYRIESDVAGNVVRVKTTIAFTRSRVAAGEYAAFRAFCEEVDRHLGQRVVATRS